MKKLLLSLGSVAAAIAPVTAVIACSPGDTSEESANELAQSLGITLGKQAADGVVLTIAHDKVNKIAPGSYYLKKEQLEVGQTFEVLSTESTGFDDIKTTKLKVVKAITAANDIGESLETVPATGTEAKLNAKNVTGKAGDAAKFTFTFKNVTTSLNDDKEVVGHISSILEEKQPKALFENSYTNKATLEKAINKVLASIGKKLGEDAITLVKPKITSISGLDTSGAVDEDKDVDTFKLTIDKQATDGVALTITADDNKNIAGGTYYLPKGKLAIDQTFEVNSTKAGKKITLKVVTAITAANDIGESLETVPATGTGEKLIAANVKGVAGAETAFFAKYDEETATVVDETAALTKIKDVLNKVLKTKYLTREEVAKTINQLLIHFGKKLETGEKENKTPSLEYTGPRITIDDALVDVKK